jgi:hypothetical protein
MNRLGFALSVIAVVATATWAYHINYRTKTALGRVDELRKQIAAEREAVEVLRVEWAYLSAPDRLARLVEANNEWLRLEPMGPQGFDDVAAVPFPPRIPTPGDPVPQDAIEAVQVITGQVSLGVRPVPMPAPRPVGWRLE